MAISRCNATGARLLLALALLFATWALLSSHPPQPPVLSHMDKLWHLLTFFGLALLSDFSWPQRGFDARKYLPLALYGALTEGLQYFVPGRELSGLDLLADVAGLATYGLLVLPLLRRLTIR